MINRLIDHYDAALFDLDGVIYIGSHGVDGAAEGISALRQLGKKIGFVTNNSRRSVKTVAEHIRTIGANCDVDDVITSAQATAQLVQQHIRPGAKVLVCGGSGLRQAILDVGYELVTSYLDQPQAVVVGYDPDTVFRSIYEAIWAVQRGAKWFASNPDLTRPVPEGSVPGAGGVILLMKLCLPNIDPIIAGKPYKPLMEYTVQRLDAKAPIFVGDRLDTDIEGANNVGIDSLLVFSGTHGKYDLAQAPAIQRPTSIGYDLRALLKPKRDIYQEYQLAKCGDQQVQIIDQQIVMETRPETVEEQLDALWAGLQLIWADKTIDYKNFLEDLDGLH